mmetsp:Transcript_23587/g.56395  ORF Transcript_23587/g.56395 Transcript_23587/m.56395 type:complete len:277 (+) Transcript_23587:35-865(+)
MCMGGGQRAPSRRHAFPHPAQDQGPPVRLMGGGDPSCFGDALAKDGAADLGPGGLQVLSRHQGEELRELFLCGLEGLEGELDEPSAVGPGQLGAPDALKVLVVVDLLQVLEEVKRQRVGVLPGLGVVKPGDRVLQVLLDLPWLPEHPRQHRLHSVKLPVGNEGFQVAELVLDPDDAGEVEEEGLGGPWPQLLGGHQRKRDEAGGADEAEEEPPLDDGLLLLGDALATLPRPAAGQELRGLGLSEPVVRTPSAEKCLPLEIGPIHTALPPRASLCSV